MCNHAGEGEESLQSASFNCFKRFGLSQALEQHGLFGTGFFDHAWFTEVCY